MADLANLGRMPAAWRYRAARRSRAIRRRITASVVEVGDRATAWLSAHAPRFALGHFYYNDERYRRAVNKGLTKDEAQRMAVSFAKLPDVIRGPQAETSPLTLLEINALATSLKDCLV